MNIYLLTRDRGAIPFWDVATGFVVAAPDQVMARSYAAAEAGSEGEAAWRDGAITKITYLGTAHGGIAPGVILKSFRSG